MKDCISKEDNFFYGEPKQGQAMNRQGESKGCKAPIRENYQEMSSYSYKEPSNDKCEKSHKDPCKDSNNQKKCKCSCLPPKDQYECCPAMTAYLTGLNLAITTSPRNYVFNHVDLGEFRSRGNSVFTVPEDGRYLISYTVRATADALFTAQVSVDGDPLPGSVFFNLLGLLTSQTQVTIADLQCGDKISLQFSGAVASLSLDSESVIASLTLVKIC